MLEGKSLYYTWFAESFLQFPDKAQFSFTTTSLCMDEQNNS